MAGLPMEAMTFTTDRVILARIPTGSDLLDELEKLCRREKVKAGVIQVIGALSGAVLGFYDQRKRSYNSLRFDRHTEIASGVGNVSLKDNDPFCHVHLVLSDETGSAYGGHLMPGCTVFAAEAAVIELRGQAPARGPDEVTGLSLWGGTLGG